MNFTLTITASNELLEAIQLLTGLMGPRPNAPKELTLEQSAQPVTARTRKTKEVAEPSVSPEPIQVVEEPQPEIAESNEPVTIETVRAAVQTKAQSGKRDHVKTLLTKFSVARVTDLPAEKYHLFLKEVEAL